jgi:hypothetical protein
MTHVIREYPRFAEQFAPDIDIVHVCGLEKVYSNMNFLFGPAATFRSTVVSLSSLLSDMF